MLNHSFLRLLPPLQYSGGGGISTGIAHSRENKWHDMKQPVTSDMPRTYVVWDTRSNAGIVFLKDMQLPIWVKWQLKSHWREAMEIYVGKGIQSYLHRKSWVRPVFFELWMGLKLVQFLFKYFKALISRLFFCSSFVLLILCSGEAAGSVSSKLLVFKCLLRVVCRSVWSWCKPVSEFHCFIDIIAAKHCWSKY